MKKFISFCLVVVMAVCLMTVPVQAAADDEVLLGRIILEASHTYQRSDGEWFKRFAEEAGYEAIVIDGKSNPDTVVNAVEDLIARGVDGLVVQPVSSSNADSVVKIAQDAGVPIVLFAVATENTTTPTLNLYEYDVYVEIGERAAKKWIEFHPDEPIKVAVFDNPSSEYEHEQRAMAFIDGVHNVDPDAEVVAMLDGGGKRDVSYNAAEDLLQAHPEANVILGITEESTLGALAAFKAAGRGVCVDGVPQTEIFCDSGNSVAAVLELFDPTSAYKITAGLSPKNDAKGQFELLQKVLNGEVGITDAYEEVVGAVIIDYWEDTLEEQEAFLADEYEYTGDLKAELEAKVAAASK